MNDILIDNAVILDALGLHSREPFECYSIGHIGFKKHFYNKMLVFCESERYLDEICGASISAVICPSNLEAEIISLGKVAIVSSDPKNDFQRLRDYLAKKNHKRFPSKIAKSAKIPSTVFISEYNVTINEDVVIQPNVTILPDVNIGAGCFIGSGAVLGTAFDAKISKLGNISNNFHDGRLIIGDRVEIHSGCVLDKGNSFHGDTTIGNDCKISHQSYIGHSSSIGEKTFILARVAIAGGVKIGKFVTIHPGVCVCSYVEIGDYSTITTGSVVAFNVISHSRMSGNFAVSHDLFMEKFKLDAR